MRIYTLSNLFKTLKNNCSEIYWKGKRNIYEAYISQEKI